LIKDNVFSKYMDLSFDASTKFVIIYSSNKSLQENNQPPHLKHRKFSEYIDRYIKDWKLFQVIPNKYSETNNGIASSFSDFYIYQRND